MSQCLTRSADVSTFVALYCGYGQLIDISRAVHGHRHDVRSSHCDVLPSDCLRDVTGQYDWSVCRGHHHCVQSVRQFNDTRHSRHCSVDNARLVYLRVSSSVAYVDLISINNISLASQTTASGVVTIICPNEIRESAQQQLRWATVWPQ